jgi:hypothetical protein
MSRAHQIVTKDPQSYLQPMCVNSVTRYAHNLKSACHSGTYLIFTQGSELYGHAMECMMV